MARKNRSHSGLRARSSASSRSGRPTDPGTLRVGTGSEPQRSPRQKPYFEATQAPLYVLLFVLPLIAIYELGFPGQGVADLGPIAAKAYLAELFESLGAAGKYLPSLTVVVTLMVWHVLSRDRWRVRPRVLVGMIVESVLLSLPLLVIGLLLDPVAAAQLVPNDYIPPEVVPGSADASSVAAQLVAVPWHGRLAVAVGAGVYEEFVFRMIGLAVVHTVISDVLRVPDRSAKVIAVIVTAVAFALYHNLTPQGPNAAGLDMQLATFYTLAGIYLGALYLVRGLGIGIGAHATYNAIVLLLVV